MAGTPRQSFGEFKNTDRPVSITDGQQTPSGDTAGFFSTRKGDETASFNRTSLVILLDAVLIITRRLPVARQKRMGFWG